jgi:hypothetical protein
MDKEQDVDWSLTRCDPSKGCIQTTLTKEKLLYQERMVASLPAGNARAQIWLLLQLVARALRTGVKTSLAFHSPVRLFTSIFIFTILFLHSLAIRITRKQRLRVLVLTQLPSQLSRGSIVRAVALRSARGFCVALFNLSFQNETTPL